MGYLVNIIWPIKCDLLLKHIAAVVIIGALGVITAAYFKQND